MSSADGEEVAGSRSPFHAGEQAVQARVGVREKIEPYGARGIRDHLTEQHREFFPQLPFLVIGTLDRRGRPWASILTGEPGFLSSPEPRQLQVAARPRPGDPAGEGITEGAPIGCLGIELPTCRRNRVNGRVARAPEGAGFTVQVGQTFGNCPKYIHPREARLGAAAGVRAQARGGSLDARARALIAAADTFFIATHAGDDPRDVRYGVDVSHRGGPSGFVQRNDDHTLTWPDYRGNFFFNTLGNLELNPRCGLLFPDFETGDMVQLTGHGEVLWDWPRDDPAYQDAQRLVRFYVDEAIVTASTV